MMSNTINSRDDAASQKEAQGNADKISENAVVKSAGTRKAAGAFRTISEVADILDVQQHVLRFWETKFTQVKPLKRGGGRRYYRPEDVELLKRIHHLLYTEGYTIKGVQKLLKGQGKQQIIDGDFGTPEGAAQNVKAANESAPAQQAATQAAPQTASRANSDPKMSDKQRSILEAMLGDLKELRDMLRGEDGNKRDAP